MSNYYGARHYGAPRYSHSRYGDMEYGGYDDTWIMGQSRGSSWGEDNHYLPHSSSARYHEQAFEPTNLRSLSYPRAGRSASNSRMHPGYGYDRPARLAWPTEIPMQMRISLCCEECKMKLDDELRDVQGVHDVSISGYANALVTVTGTASASKLLSRARRVSKTAELWSNDGYY